METLKDYILKNINESSDEVVYAVKDETGAILNVFPDKKDADDDIKNWPEESNVKVVTLKKSEIES